MEKVFAEHLPAEVLEAGIKSGRYIQVSLSSGYVKAHIISGSCLNVCIFNPHFVRFKGNSECEQTSGPA